MSYTLYDKKVIEILALSLLLQQGEQYAYSIMKQIKALSGGAVSVVNGSLYPVLYSLKDRGCLTDRTVAVGKSRKMNRVYYNMTPAGVEYLQTLLAERELIQSSIERIRQSAAQGGKP